MEKEEEYEDGKEEEYGKEQQEDLEKDDGGGGEEQQGGEGQVNPDEMEAGQGEQDEMDDDGQGHQEKQKQDGWWGQQGWWKRNWHKGKGRNYGGARHPRPHKPHWASWKPRQRSFSSGSAKGTGKGKFDAWGGEYCVGGYKDVAGNFYERL